MDGSSKKRSKSPIGINMLNGRVYGSRVMESAKQVEKEAQKGEVFKEWGDSGLGSNSRAEEEDEDDGSGEFRFSLVSHIVAFRLEEESSKLTRLFRSSFLLCLFSLRNDLDQETTRVQTEGGTSSSGS